MTIIGQFYFAKMVDVVLGEIRMVFIINRAEFRDKVMGCWLGKNAGGTLGDYYEEKYGQDELFDVSWYKDIPEGGIPNDDLEMQLVWLQKILEKGPGLTASDLGDAWLECIAYNFDEYGLSKTNLMKGLAPPVCGWHNNSFKYCMGSPIRSEIWACIAPGCPDLAAWYAYQDAIVDHGGGESVYGEIFNAAIESAAFANKDKVALIELGLSYIPEDSKVYGSIKTALDNWRAGVDWVTNRNEVKEKFFHPVAQSTPINMGFQIIGWLYGEDFGDTLCKAVACGWDTDCTAATLGSIWGILHGASGLPQKWIAPLGDNISTNATIGGLKNLTAPTNIQQLTETVCALAERVVKYWNRDVIFTDDCAPKQLDVTFPSGLSWLAESHPGTIIHNLGGFIEELTYHDHAAIRGDKPSKITFSITNPHPEPVDFTLSPILPAGFVSLPSDTQSRKADPGQKVRFELEISAPADAILETNKGYLVVEAKNYPAIPAIPLVFVGAVRWMVSPLFKGAGLNDDLGVKEDSIFISPPAGFTDEWRAGTELELAGRFGEGGVIYMLHQLYSEWEDDVLIGVSNNGRMKFFVNGDFIHETKEVVPVRAVLGNKNALGDLSNYAVAKFRKGWNQILIKLKQENTPHEAHLTLGKLSSDCSLNHGIPLFDICRSEFIWERNK